MVGGLGRGESGAVDAVVEVCVDPGIEGVDLRKDGWGKKSGGAFGGFAEVGGEEGVEGGEEDADDLGGFVVYDCFCVYVT